MISRVFTDCPAQVCTLPCIGKSCGRQPSAEPTTSERSIVGYTSHFSLRSMKCCLTSRFFSEVDHAV